MDDGDDRRVRTAAEPSLIVTGDSTRVRSGAPAPKRACPYAPECIGRTGVADRVLLATLGTGIAKRLEDWKFGLVGFVGSALLAALIVSPLAGILYAAVVTSLVLTWSVIATWIAQRDEARGALRVDEGTRRPALTFGLPELPAEHSPSATVASSPRNMDA